jgi:phosphate transport system substrate-binding protein
MQYPRRLAAYALAALLAAGAFAAQADDRLVYTGDLPATSGFMRDLAVLFEARTGIRTELRLADTSTAIRATARGDSHLGGATRPALPDPRETGVTLYPVAWDALAIITHPDNTVDNITLADLGAVLAGDLDNWQALGGADTPIALLLPADPMSGVRYNLDAALTDATNASATGYAGPDLQAVRTGVAANPGALGVTSLASLHNNEGRAVKVLDLEGVSPSPEALVAGDYLLFQPLQLALRETGGPAERFVRFAQSPVARRILRRNGAVPYMDGLNLVGQQFDRENLLRRAAQP